MEVTQELLSNFYTELSCLSWSGSYSANVCKLLRKINEASKKVTNDEESQVKLGTKSGRKSRNKVWKFVGKTKKQVSVFALLY